MIDWFVLLAPLLLLPIALLFFFVGCTFNGDSAVVPEDTNYDAMYKISFYLDNDNLGHTYEFKIFDSTFELDCSEADTDHLKILGGPGEWVQGIHQFTGLLPAGSVELTCEVRDLSSNNGGLPEITVAMGPSCLTMIDGLEQYCIEFIVSLSVDGTPNEQFDPCQISTLDSCETD